ncbi:hypothetical protein LB504_007196 [Fusarium proliferatum]|nr:hypothetical protein LB504_007196 [Fusarium proliferatum]
MTYSPVLSQQVLNRSESERLDIIKSFCLIVGAIITLANLLSMRALALLLDIHISKVMTRLSALHSVLDIPETLNAPVRLLYLSFRDYLVGLEKRELAGFRRNTACALCAVRCKRTYAAYLSQATREEDAFTALIYLYTLGVSLDVR